MNRLSRPSQTSHSPPGSARPTRRLARWLPALLLTSSLAFAESGSLLKDTELRSEPLGSADVVKPLSAKQVVDVSARQGAWAKVTTADGATGWVRVLNLRTGSGEKGRAGFGSLASVFATGSSGNAVSTGVKGLSAEQLRSASPNWSDAERLDSYVADAGAATTFAGQVPLQSQSLDYLPIDSKKRSRK